MQEKDPIKGPYYYDGQNENKKYYWDEGFGEIHFMNERQGWIWLNCVLGQLSDGYWENSNVDYIFWFKLKVICDGKLGWKVNDDSMPIGIWPVQLNFIYEEIIRRVKYKFDEYEDIELEINNGAYNLLQLDIQSIEDSMGTSLRPIGYIDQTVSDTIEKYEEIKNSDWFKRAYENKSLYPGEKKEIPLRIRKLMERCKEGNHEWKYYMHSEKVDEFFNKTGFVTMLGYPMGEPKMRGCLICGKIEQQREEWI